MWIKLIFIVFLLPLVNSSQLTRFQRGDQGPDDIDEFLEHKSYITTKRVKSPVGGPNVCRSRNSANFCCPGWSQRGLLCIIPECSGCGQSGRCIKPNLCICSDGSVSPKCDDTSISEGCTSTCLNGGVCELGSCKCRSGYAGRYCQEPVCKKSCENGGRCIGPNRCACVYGYTGRYCEIDYRTGPCYRRVTQDSCNGQLHGVVCTKQLCCATIGKAWGHPCEKCSADSLSCRKGFLKNVHTGICMDINECEAIPGLCSGGDCINNEGSFECICPHGMTMDENHECRDEDECSAYHEEEICRNGSCINRDPGYYCLCNEGYIPTQDQKACLDARQGYCYSDLSSGRCSNRIPFQISRLDCCCGKSLRGVAWSSSRSGCDSCPEKGSQEYKDLCKVASNIIQETIDPCAIGSDLCGDNGECIATHSGGYQCSCNKGYELSPDGKRCIDEDECSKGFCSGRNSLRCRNYEGSFECLCKDGYHLSSNGRECINHNECSQIGRCMNGQCINNQCQCNEGFVINNNICEDVDECLENPLICLHGKCINTPGGYVCQCQNGFTHSPDGGFCLDENECSNSNFCKNGNCINTEGGYRCICDPGYAISYNREHCEDIDECRSNPCGLTGTCQNEPGGFRCDCPIGFTLGPDGRTCSDQSVTGYCYSLLRDNQCLNPSSKFISKSTCCCSSVISSHLLGWGNPCSPCPIPGSSQYHELCPHGDGFTNGGDDINECSINPDICGEFGMCENLIGSYRCICNPGFEIIEDLIGKQKCRDIDECSVNPEICNGGQCRNTDGSYNCICPTGTNFNEINGSCLDINECELDPNICIGGTCINIHGGFNCKCPPGSVLDSTGMHCLDNRKGSCWRAINDDDQCENNLRSLTFKAECCCSSIGLAWGSPCERCKSEDCNCPTGMAKLDGGSCTDIDECSLDPNICEGGTCVNTHGGFKCKCPPGLSLDESETKCLDQRLEPCYLDYRLGVCTQSLGGYYKRDKCCCTLGEGWGYGCSQCPRPGSDAFNELCAKGYGFVDLSDVNECISYPDICLNGRCKNSIGSFTCRCNQGYALDEYGVTCVNINECEIMFGVCGNGTCIDIPGSFTCQCDAGFEITPLMQVCMDINECERDKTLCRGGQCINTPGSFHCSCPPGHELSEDGKYCKDIDECSLTSGVCSNGICENMMGAYQCICDIGFSQTGNGYSCGDIDECTTNNGGCDDLCVNSPGSYSCACAFGFELLQDGTSCKDINECVDRNPCNGGKCVNIPGGYSCICSGGLMMGPDASSCLDLDECAINQNVCKNGKCENTLGSFKCLCDDGYTIHDSLEDGCLDVDECDIDIHHCHPEALCNNTLGSYECNCKDGFRGDGFECKDINECSLNNGGCDVHASCINTEGGFHCVCDQGFDGDDGFHCQDIDECADNPTLCDNGVCVNELGSFKCECQMGYMHPSNTDSQACIDVNECALFGDSICVNGICENFDGVFRCVCDPGFTLDDTGGNCTDIDECSDPMSCKYGTCINTKGSYDCKCPDHFKLMPSKNGCVDNRSGICYSSVGNDSQCNRPLGFDISRAGCCCSSGVAWGNECEICPEPGTDQFADICPGGKGFKPNKKTLILEDIDECREMEGICDNGRCTNMFGSFMCTCTKGFKLDHNRITCIDIDECSENPNICGDGECINVNGGFECNCRPGYVLSPDGSECVDMRKETCYLNYNDLDFACSKPMSRPQTKIVCCCSMGKAWGDGCETCPKKGSIDYKKLCGNGSPGMIVDPITGITKELDECQLMPGMCQHGKCINTVGSFKCDCHSGYVYDQSSHQCIDKNECDLSQNPCLGNAQCINTPGSFKCLCPDGYELDHTRRNCLDIDECLRNPCRNGRCKNGAGSYNCVCDEGFVSSATGGDCLDRDECSGNPGICGNGTCYNTFGSHRCICEMGFLLNDNGYCQDIDECQNNRFGNVCRNGRCVNTKGSFTCQCAEGYKLSGTSCVDIDECLDNICEHTCTNSLGSYACSCPKGYQLESVNKHDCIDINECLEENDKCIDGYCRNTQGGYVCECSPNWILDKEESRCIDIRSETCYREYQGGFCMGQRLSNMTRQNCCCTKGAAWGNLCEECPTPGSKEFKTLCPNGIGRGTNGEDFNECEIIENLCQEGTCINTDGGYRCECSLGYILDSLGNRCVDDNECLQNPKICGNGTCTNIEGGFECNCVDGYAPGPIGTCQDINECREYGHQCAFRCHNTPGSFRCVCPYGFTLAPDGRHCMDIDECDDDIASNNCRYQCKNLIGSFMCICPEGFRKLDNGDDECEDIDECEDDPCGQGASNCINTQGGYQCSCEAGYELSIDGRDCLDVRKGYCFHKLSNGRCLNKESGVIQSLVTKADCCCTLGAAWGAECKSCPPRGSDGFRQLCSDSGFSIQGKDIDECSALGEELCPNGQCINTMGSYRCICDRGFKPDSKSGGIRCIDVDECRTLRPCQHQCKNTIGSYECSCPSGFLLEERTGSCRDIDECHEEIDTCENECVNTQGSYTCTCPPGFNLLGERCIDIDECIEQQGLCPPPGTCKNTKGSFKCVCPRGYRLDDTGTFCVDSNECESSIDQCGSGNECINRLGSFNCERNECLSNPCGKAECRKSYTGSYSCECPMGYNFDSKLLICVQATCGGNCAFGCTGGAGGCACPNGYNRIAQGHCMAINEPYFEDNSETDEGLIATEGCFACKMNRSSRKRHGRRYKNRKNRRRISVAHIYRRSRYKRYIADQTDKFIYLRIPLNNTNTRDLLYLQSAILTNNNNSTSYLLKGPNIELYRLKQSKNLWKLSYLEQNNHHPTNQNIILSAIDKTFNLFINIKFI